MKKQLLKLLGLVLIGCIVMFYGINLLMADVLNYAIGFSGLVVSLAFFALCLDITCICLGYARYIKDKDKYGKAIIKSTLIKVIVISIIGIICTILGAITVYKDMFSGYPFVGYSVFMIIIHISLIVLSIYAYKKVLVKIKNDPSKRVFSIKYVFYRVLVSLLFVYGLNKFGAFIYSPIYMTYRLALFTTPFYLSLVVCLVSLALLYLYEIKFIKDHKKIKIISIILLSLSIIFTLSNIVCGALSTKYVAAVSLAVPLERLASMPMDSLFVRPIVNIGLAVLYFIIVNKDIKNKDK